MLILGAIPIPDKKSSLEITLELLKILNDIKPLSL
jgi:hypothetical protein